MDSQSLTGWPPVLSTFGGWSRRAVSSTKAAEHGQWSGQSPAPCRPRGRPTATFILCFLMEGSRRSSELLRSFGTACGKYVTKQGFAFADPPVDAEYSLLPIIVVQFPRSDHKIGGQVPLAAYYSPSSPPPPPDRLTSNERFKYEKHFRPWGEHIVASQSLSI